MSIEETVLRIMREYSTPERPVYLVGGAVRDMILGRAVRDMDFVLPGETRSLAKEIAGKLGGALYVLDDERQTMRIVLDTRSVPGLPPGERFFLDFAAFRAENLEGDLWDRDFTINAMAWNVARPGQLIDPTGGLGHLTGKRIQACSPSSLLNDPVRILRAVRLAVELDFRLEPGAVQLMREAVGFLPQVSAERLRDELFKILSGPKVALAIRLLDRVGALHYTLPELEGLKGVAQTPPHVMDVWEHTLSTLQHLEQLLQPLVGKYVEESVADLSVGSAVLWLGRYRDFFEEHFNQLLVPDRTIRSLLFFAALYHDIEKPTTRQATPDGRARFFDHPQRGADTVAQRGRQLALSASEISRLETIVKDHMYVHLLAKPSGNGKGHPLSRKAIYRFFRETRQAGVDICLLSLADTRGTYGATLSQEVWESELETCRLLLEAYWEKTEDIITPPQLVSGDDLISTFGLQPGKEIGQILAAIRETQAAGEIHTHDQALDYARAWLEKKLDPKDLAKGRDFDE